MYATLCTVLKELPVRLKQRDHIFAHSGKCESARSASDKSLHHLQGRRYFAHSEKCESARSASDKILSTILQVLRLDFQQKVHLILMVSTLSFGLPKRRISSLRNSTIISTLTLIHPHHLTSGPVCSKVNRTY